MKQLHDCGLQKIECVGNDVEIEIETNGNVLIEYSCKSTYAAISTVWKSCPYCGDKLGEQEGRENIETTLKEKLEIIGAVTPVLAELNRFGEILFEMNTEARLVSREMMNKGVEGAEAKLLILEGEIRKQEQDLNSRLHFISIVVWELIDSICEERGFVHYRDLEENQHDTSDGVSISREE